MALEGPLKEMRIQDVFQLLVLGRKSGTLRVTSELRQAAATVCFERGALVADRHTRTRMEEAILDLLTWTEGYFRFDEGVACDPAGDRPVRIRAEALLLEAARRVDEWSRIEATVSHLGLVPRLQSAEGADGRLDLVPFEWQVLAAVDGERDLRGVADLLGRPELEVARTVYGLATAGVVTLEDPAPETGEAAPRSETLLAPVVEALAREDYGRALELVNGVLRLDPLLPEARRLLGLSLAGLGRLREAAEAWDGWSRLGTRSEAEQSAAPDVERLREAARTLARELEVFRVEAFRE